MGGVLEKHSSESLPKEHYVHRAIPVVLDSLDLNLSSSHACGIANLGRSGQV